MTTPIVYKNTSEEMECYRKFLAIFGKMNQNVKSATIDEQIYYLDFLYNLKFDDSIFQKALDNNLDFDQMQYIVHQFMDFCKKNGMKVGEKNGVVVSDAIMKDFVSNMVASMSLLHIN